MTVTNRAYPLRFRGDTSHLRLVSGFGYLGQYSPAPSLIKNTDPEPGLFFRPLKYISVWAMCKAAYGKPDVFKGIKAVKNSKWNAGHIRYARSGYENYGFDGPQMQAKYDPSNPYSKYKSGTAFPTFWLPPLATLLEPEQVFVTEPEIIPPGPGPTPEPKPPVVIPPEPTPGPVIPGQGPKGDPGRGPTEAEINKAVIDYFKLNPPKAGPPGKMGPPGQTITGPAGQSITGPPGPPGQATAEAINQAVIDHFKQNPPAAGPPGQSVIGPPGPGPTMTEIRNAVRHYFETHPMPSGVSPEAIKEAVAEYIAAHPPEMGFSWAEVEKYINDALAKIPSGVASSPIWAGVATFAVLGLLIKGTR